MAQCPGRTIGTATLTTQPADCCRGGPWLSLFICQPAGAGPSTRSSWSRAGGAAIPPCQALATAPLPTSRIWIPSGPGLTPWLAPLWLTDHRNGWGSSAGGGWQLRELDLQAQRLPLLFARARAVRDHTGVRGRWAPRGSCNVWPQPHMDAEGERWTPGFPP